MGRHYHREEKEMFKIISKNEEDLNAAIRLNPELFKAFNTIKMEFENTGVDIVITIFNDEKWIGAKLAKECIIELKVNLEKAQNMLNKYKEEKRRKGI